MLFGPDLAAIGLLVILNVDVLRLGTCPLKSRHQGCKASNFVSPRNLCVEQLWLHHVTAAPEYFELTATLVSMELHFCLAFILDLDFRTFWHAQSLDLRWRTQAHFVIEAVLVASCLGTMAAVVWVERLRQLERVRGSHDGQLHDELKLELGDLLRGKIAKFDRHDFSTLRNARCQDGSIARSNRIIVSLYSLLFGSHLGLHCAPVDRDEQLGEHGCLFNWHFESQFKGIVCVRVLVLQVEVYDRETCPDISVDLNCPQWKHGFHTLVKDVHAHVLAAAPITLLWKSLCIYALILLLDCLNCQTVSHSNYFILIVRSVRVEAFIASEGTPRV